MTQRVPVPEPNTRAIPSPQDSQGVVHHSESWKADLDRFYQALNAEQEVSRGCRDSLKQSTAFEGLNRLRSNQSVPDPLAQAEMLVSDVLPHKYLDEIVKNYLDWPRGVFIPGPDNLYFWNMEMPALCALTSYCRAASFQPVEPNRNLTKLLADAGKFLDQRTLGDTIYHMDMDFGCMLVHNVNGKVVKFRDLLTDARSGRPLRYSMLPEGYCPHGACVPYKGIFSIKCIVAMEKGKYVHCECPTCDRQMRDECVASGVKPLRSAPHIGDAWVKDLTNEGIHPNPGPKGKKKASKPRPKAKLRGKLTAKNQTVVVRQPGVKGKGGFLGDVFSKAGSWLGGVAGNALGGLVGLGAYRTKQNTLLTDTGPPLVNGGDGSITITKREFLTDVSSTINFTVSNYAINPGLVGTFPWLSSLVANFEEWTPLGILFQYKSTSGSAIASTNNALGTVIMATNYDVDDPLFVSKQQMEDYEFATSCSSAGNMLHPIECAPGKNVLSNLYTRISAVPSGQDSRFYDLGNFQIATVGQQANGVVIGELWVTYHIKLSKPRLTSLSDVASIDHFQFTQTGATTYTTPVAVTGSGGNTSLAYVSSNTFQLTATKPSVYLVIINYSGAAFTATGNIAKGSATNFSPATVWSDNTGFDKGQQYVTTGTSPTLQSFSGIYNNGVAGQPVPKGATINFVIGANYASATSYIDVYVLPYSANVLTVANEERELGEALGRLSRRYPAITRFIEPTETKGERYGVANDERHSGSSSRAANPPQTGRWFA